MRVLCINCGSSSLKFALRDAGKNVVEQLVAGGAIEGVGSAARLHFAGEGLTNQDTEVAAPGYSEAMRIALDALDEASLLSGIDAVGHRVVHGGSRLTKPTLVDEETLAALDALVELAPLHNAPAIEALRAARVALGPDTPMVAVLDTAFYADLPARASTYALPRGLVERHQIRRYGFHGLAHRYMLERYATIRPEGGLRIVSLQLGSGCSATASIDGHAVDTSMGFTPLEGLVMGTRSGDIDPAIPAYLAEKENLSFDQVQALLNRESGLLGLAGASNMRSIEEAAAAGEPAASLALDVFCYRIVKYIGSYMAAMGGLDALLFGGGIGERSVEVPKRVCHAFAWAGLEWDSADARARSGLDVRLSRDGSRIETWIVSVDEESIVARDVAKTLGG